MTLRRRIIKTFKNINIYRSYLMQQSTWNIENENEKKKTKKMSRWKIKIAYCDNKWNYLIANAFDHVPKCTIKWRKAIISTIPVNAVHWWLMMMMIHIINDMIFAFHHKIARLLYIQLFEYAFGMDKYESEKPKQKKDFALGCVWTRQSQNIVKRKKRSKKNGFFRPNQRDMNHLIWNCWVFCQNNKSMLK